MEYKKLFKNILLYAFFPIGIVFLGLKKEYWLLGFLIVIYFTVFALIRREELYIIQAGMRDKSNKSALALKSMFKAYKLKNSSMDTANKFIYMLLKSGKIDKCSEIIEAVEKREKEDVENELFLSNKALYLWKKNAISESIAIYDQLITTHQSTSLYSAYGFILTLGDDLEKALKINLEAYEFNNASKGIMDNLGLTYIKLGKLDEAYDLYEKLINKKPNFPEAYYNMAILMQLKGEITDAKHYVKLALEKPFNGLSTVSKKEVEQKLDQINRLQGTLV